MSAQAHEPAGLPEAATRVPPLLVFGWGNPGRGDDALGPALCDALEARLFDASAPVAAGSAQVEVLQDFQLQVEHTLDLLGRRAVLLVDASAAADAPPVCLRPLSPASPPDFCKCAFTSHALSPEALLAAFAATQRVPPPAIWLLEIRGESFVLGEALTPGAQANLAQAIQQAEDWLATQLQTVQRSG